MTDDKIFLMAGRTGGPLMPLLAISKNLSQYQSVVIGVRGGFEEQVCSSQNLYLEYLPEAKLTLLSYSKASVKDWFINLAQSLVNLITLARSLFICQRLLLKHKPKAIFSTGSFLAVPMIYTASFLKGLGLLDTKIIIHQQDPLPGLANRLTIKLANYQTCVFDYTRRNFSAFKNCGLIPNPIDTSRFDNLSIESIRNSDLQIFLGAKSYKPVLLIFGGGSGAKFINDWVWQNLDRLLENFKVVHLSGSLQNINLQEIKKSYSHPDYLLLESLLEDMPVVLKFCDLVICRAGLSSITELDYLSKRALLVPIPDSHQEINADQVRDRYTILNHGDSLKWLELIFIKATEPLPDTGLQTKIQSDIKNRLLDYSVQIKQLLES